MTLYCLQWRSQGGALGARAPPSNAVPRVPKHIITMFNKWASLDGTEIQHIASVNQDIDVHGTFSHPCI